VRSLENGWNAVNVSERLNSSVKKGARTSMTDLSVGVGSGSRVQLLSGSTRTAAGVKRMTHHHHPAICSATETIGSMYRVHRFEISVVGYMLQQ